MKDNHTPGPWQINDRGRESENDKIEYPWEARYEIWMPGNDRWIANVLSTNGDSPHANAKLITASVNSYHKNCGDRAVECAESDLLGECLEALEIVKANSVNPAHTMTKLGLELCMDANYKIVKAILAKRKGEYNE